MTLTPIVLTVVLALASWVIARASSAQIARRSGTVAAVLAVVIAGAALTVQPMFTSVGPGMRWLPPGALAALPLLIAVAQLVAVGLAPISGHSVSTVSRIVLLFALAQSSLASAHPLWLLATWVGTAVVAWHTYRKATPNQRAHRVFGIYQSISVIAFTAGAVLLSVGAAPTMAAALILAAIAIRQGVVPFHSWFPDFVEHAPMGLVVAFFAPQLGLCAHITLFDSAADVVPLVIPLLTVTTVGAALMGAAQNNARRALAYLALSQLGAVSIGLVSASSMAHEGALLNWGVLALATSGLLMALAGIEARRGKVSLAVPSGDFSQTPRLAVAFLILGSASVGFPLMLGFIGEDLLLEGTSLGTPLLTFALVVAAAFNGVTTMRSFFYLFTGTRDNAGASDLGRRERYVVGAVIAAMLVLGVAPRLVLGHASPVHADEVAQNTTP